MSRNTMLANILVSPGKLELREVEIPAAGPGEVLIKVKAALTCGTDLKAFLRGHPQIPMPGPFGHEFSGVVAEVGSGVRSLRDGDPVMSVHSAPCGDCYWCRRDQGNLCPSVMETKVLGAYAEYVRVPARIVRQNLYPKPNGLSFEEAALLEPLACVVYGLNQIRLHPEDTVLVIGPGAVGLLHLLALKARGVGRVIVAGRRKFRLDLAGELGAVSVSSAAGSMSGSAAGDADGAAKSGLADRIFEETSGRGADVVIECTGRAEVWQEALSLVRKGGQVVLFGGPPQGTSLTCDTHRLHYGQITLYSPFHFNPAAVRQARDLLAEGTVRAGRLITGSFPLRELNRAFSLLQAGDCVKYALKP